MTSVGSVTVAEITVGQPCRAGLFIQRGGQMLYVLARREKWVEEGGVLRVRVLSVGGKLEEGESITECALREGREEMGCSVALLSSPRTFYYQREEGTLSPIASEDEIAPLIVEERGENDPDGLRYHVVYAAAVLGLPRLTDQVGGLLSIPPALLEPLSRGLRVKEALVAGVVLQPEGKVPEDAVLWISKTGTTLLLPRIRREFGDVLPFEGFESAAQTDA